MARAWRNPPPAIDEVAVEYYKIEILMGIYAKIVGEPK
jgi:hypothetical protein